MNMKHATSLSIKYSILFNSALENSKKAISNEVLKFQLQNQPQAQ